jgi:hypothetical protein
MEKENIYSLRSGGNAEAVNEDTHFLRCAVCEILKFLLLLSGVFFICDQDLGY